MKQKPIKAGLTKILTKNLSQKGKQFKNEIKRKQKDSRKKETCLQTTSHTIFCASLFYSTTEWMIYGKCIYTCAEVFETFILCEAILVVDSMEKNRGRLVATDDARKLS